MEKDNDEEMKSEEIEEARLINEEYKNWKKNSPEMYDLVITRSLEWPSPTVEWLPQRKELPWKDYSSQKLILGTHNTDDEPNYLVLAEVQLPLDDSEDDTNSEDDDTNAGDGRPDMKVQVVQQINHDGVVNRARHLPVNPFFVATKTTSAEVYVFDCPDHPIRPPASGACKPKYRLRGHETGGYGLTWSDFNPGELLSGSDDAQICLWDLVANTSLNEIVDACRKFKVHEGAVNDVAWHSKNEHLFGSAGDDRRLFIWDLRDPCVTKPAQFVIAHQSETIKLFDLRKLNNPVHTFDFHEEEIFQVGWNRTNETILASCCGGGRLLVWDLSRIGEEQTSEDAEEGPPELLFIHGGHTSEISDFSWNPRDDWMVASVAEDNILQIWQMSEHIYNDEDDFQERNPYLSLLPGYWPSF